MAEGRPAIRVANAPCSWGIVEGIGSADGPDWCRVVNEIERAGYSGTELGDRGFMPEDPPLLRDELGAHGLSLMGAFVPVRLSDVTAHAEGETSALRAAHLLEACVRGTPDEGAPFVILADDPGLGSHRLQHAGRIGPGQGLDDARWRTAAACAERIARAVSDETGLRTVFHHHCGTWVETPAETETMMRLTSPDLLGLCLDTGHCAYGGGDPLAALRRFKERVWHVHLKDCDPVAVGRARAGGWDYVRAVRGGIFCGLGEGDVPNAAVLDELRRLGYSGWVVVENEAPPGPVSPFEYAVRDRAYLKGVGL